MQYLNDIEIVGNIIAASLSPFALALGAMMALVVPTKWKLESILTDRQVFEAQQREE